MVMNIHENKTGIIGIVTVRQHPAGTIDALNAILKNQPKNAGGAAVIPDEAAAILQNGRIATSDHNIVVVSTDRGRNLIVQKLAGVDAYTMHVTHGDIGTSTGTATAADTQIGTAVARAALAGYTVSSNVVTLQFFFADSALANNTYREFGTFVDGATGTSTGRLFNHASFSSAYVKTSGVDTTIEVTITLTSS